MIVILKANEYNLQSAPVCHVELTSLDIDTGEDITIGDSNLAVVAETNITFTTTQQLRQNRHYNVTVTASNIVGQITTSSAVIS